MVRPRSRPPSSNTVIDGDSARALAANNEEVTTVSGPSGESASATNAGVTPSSMYTLSAPCSRSAAAAAILRFSAIEDVVRWAMLLSKPALSTGNAPPWVRRRSPRLLSWPRSRRTVSGAASSSAASVLTSTRPSARARFRIRRWRSSALMRPAPPMLAGHQLRNSDPSHKDHICLTRAGFGEPEWECRDARSQPVSLVVLPANSCCQPFF